MNKMKEWIKQSPILHFWGRVIQNCRSAGYRQSVIDISEHPAMVRVEKKGELFPDRLFYLIHLDDAGQNSGFFALFNQTLKRLELAKRLNAAPFIMWIHSAYSDRTIKNTQNVYEYYFVQPGDIDYSELQKASNIIISKSTDGFYLSNDSLYLQLENHLEEAVKIYRRYIRLRESVRSDIQLDITNSGLYAHFENIIGVHVRGTDYTARWKGHPVPVTLEEYVTATKQQMAKMHIDEVFLATDDKRAVRCFQAEFGDHLHFFDDVARGEGEQGVHYLKAERPHHQYRMGYEVLRDVYTLAQCKGFIGGMSQVGFAVRVINMAEFKKFEREQVIDKGINEKGVSSSRMNRIFAKEMINEK